MFIQSYTGASATTARRPSDPAKIPSSLEVPRHHSLPRNRENVRVTGFGAGGSPFSSGFDSEFPLKACPKKARTGKNLRITAIFAVSRRAPDSFPDAFSWLNRIDLRTRKREPSATGEERGGKRPPPMHITVSPPRDSGVSAFVHARRAFPVFVTNKEGTRAFQQRNSWKYAREHWQRA